MTQNEIFQMKVQPTRGTKLYKNAKKTLHIEFIAEEGHDIGPTVRFSLMIIGDFLGKIGHIGIASKNGYKVIVPPEKEYMIINNSPNIMNIQFNDNFKTHEVIYDPYLYENEEHEIVKADEFRNKFDVPEGFVDSLEKWYSVKFTYPDINYIFVKPGLGISFQSHKMRQEHWEIGSGSPIIISGSKVHYNTEVGQKFDISLGNIHTVINPHKDEWILLKERYSGKFDEEDIERIFNPNNYISPNSE